MIDNPNTINYRFALLGDSEVGKTAIFKKISYGSFRNSVATFGFDKETLSFHDLEFEINGNQIKRSFEISLFDTAGQERFRSITKNHILGSDGIILIYDITNRESFDHLEEWLTSIKEVLSDWRNSKYLIIVYGNKLDLVENNNKERQVTAEEGENLCDNEEIIWGGECSAKNFTEEQFLDLFKDFTKKIYYKNGDSNNRNSIKIKKHKLKKIKCCKN